MVRQGLTGLSVSPAPILAPSLRTIWGTVRTEEKREALESRGISAFVFDPDNLEGLPPEGLAALQSSTHVLSSVPPVGDRDRDPVLTMHFDELARLARPWIGYLSSTSVYGCVPCIALSSLLRMD